MTNTTKTAIEVLDEAINPQTDADKAQERADKLVREAKWLRERALENALTLHKQNGGMSQPERIIEDARKFLAFTQGA
jgi:hypothetical protein